MADRENAHDVSIQNVVQKCSWSAKGRTLLSYQAAGCARTIGGSMRFTNPV